MGLLVLAAFFLTLRITNAALLQDSVATETLVVEVCDTLRLAKLYTYCTVPFYGELYGKNLPLGKTCFYVQGFMQCTSRAEKMSGCSNQQYLIKPTMQYFSSVALDAYAKLCNITTVVDEKAESQLEIHISYRGRNLPRTFEQQVDRRSDSEQMNQAYPAGSQGYIQGSVYPEAHGHRVKRRAASFNVVPNETLTGSVGTDSNTPPNRIVSPVSTEAQKQTEVSFKNGARQAGQSNTATSNLSQSEIITHAPRSHNGEAQVTDSPATITDTNNASSVSVSNLLPQDDKPRRQVSNRTEIVVPSENAADTTAADISGSRLQENVTDSQNAQLQRRIFLRSFFKCGVSFQQNFTVPNACQFYNSYQECVHQAMVKLNQSTPYNEDSAGIAVRALADLMTAMHDTKCQHVPDPNDIGSPLTSCCNQPLAQKQAFMCSAVYFYLSDSRTPALWPSTQTSCSSVTDLQRCTDFALELSKCKSCELSTHVSKFVATVIQPHQDKCVTEIDAQPMAEYTKEDCQQAMVFKRAFACANAFQEMIELEGIAEISQDLTCGHASRLHTCLEDSIESTGCIRDMHITSQLKMYKKLIEDEYSVNCVDYVQREKARSNLQKSKEHGTEQKSRLTIYRLDDSSNSAGPDDTTGLQSSLGLPSNLIGNGHYRLQPNEAELQRSKLDMEGGWKALNQWQAERQQSKAGGRPNEEASWMNKRFSRWRTMKQKDGPAGKDETAQETNVSQEAAVRREDLTLRGADSNDTLIKVFNQSGTVASHVNAVRILNGVLRHGKRGKRRDFEEEYYFGHDYDHHGHLSALPEELKMLEQMKAAAPKVMNVLQNSTTPSAALIPDSWKCPLEKLQPSLKQCEDSLLTLMSRWPKEINDSAHLVNATQGTQLICGDIASYKGCLLRVLKANNCDHPQILEEITKEKGNVLHLPMCSAASYLMPEVVLLSFFAAVTLIKFL
ncbi:uncharacterized protein LOC135378118 [Ornithodoros turicata]|uniref:uncharacterized protein LOC135378118 n=1 Tax=Ornithodoros turicata TaxID=34597 RepID=UPI003138B97C